MTNTHSRRRKEIADSILADKPDISSVSLPVLVDHQLAQELKFTEARLAAMTPGSINLDLLSLQDISTLLLSGDIATSTEVLVKFALLGIQTAQMSKQSTSAYIRTLRELLEAALPKQGGGNEELSATATKQVNEWLDSTAPPKTP